MSRRNLLSYISGGVIASGHAVKFGANESTILNGDGSGFGVAMNDAERAGLQVDVALAQDAKVRLGGDVVFGDSLKIASTGKFVKANPTDKAFAIALESGAADELISVEIDRHTA